MLWKSDKQKDAFCKSTLNIDPRVIIALDLDNIDDVQQLINVIGNNVATLKVGMKLFTKYGPSLITKLKELGYNVFLDLKYHDIPNTVKSACYEATALGVSMLTIHCSGGKDMCKAAVEGAVNAADKYGLKVPAILGVTILTSIDQKSLSEIGFNACIADQVVNMAKMAINEGVHGIVCSAQEVANIKKQIEKDFIAVTPGIRLADDSCNDQARVATPSVAIANGADYLVIGRPVYAAQNPVTALEKIYVDLRN